MDFRNAWAIAVKDMREVFSSVSIYGPMLAVPLFFAIVLPVLTFYVTIYAAPSVIARISSLPSAPPILQGANAATFMRYFAINVLGPIFLTMPILTSSVISADSFAGEKERKTAEALLATPVKKSELLLGKIMASFIPTIILTVAVFAIYGTVTNTFAMGSFHEYILPTAAWLMMILTSPFLAIVTIGIVVLVSSHVRGVKESQQISTLIILPVLIMPFISILGLASLTVTFFAYVILILAAMSLALFYVSIRTFRKDRML
ncbi:ABC transporter permease subunit [Candidatus Marsarchaeota archaeon]|nr:ABC transporter permease subunit [Candidatus Marsarchaeota archaeon]